MSVFSTICVLLVKGKIVISVISFLLGRFCTQPWWSNTCFHFIPPELLVLLMVPIRMECTRLWTYLYRYEPDAPCWRRQMETFSALLALCAVNSPHKCQWRGALMFSLICAWTNGCANNRDAGDLRKPRAHYDATVMLSTSGVCVCESQTGVNADSFGNFKHKVSLKLRPRRVFWAVTCLFNCENVEVKSRETILSVRLCINVLIIFAFVNFVYVSGYG